jgi:sulfur carrier protein
MQVTVNGDVREVAEGTSVAALVESIGLQVGSVVVEHNGAALLRSEVAAAVLADGDVLELVKAVAGG